MAYKYFNDGMSMSCVEEGYTPSPGEAVFEEIATDAELAANFPNYASARGADKKVHLRLYAGFVHAQMLQAGILFNVATSGSALEVLCDGTDATAARLGSLWRFGATSPTATRDWVDNNGHSTTLTGAQFMTLDAKVGEWVSNTYAKLGEINDAITAGSVTTNAQIDAEMWPAA